MPAIIRFSSLQFLLLPNDGSSKSRNWLPVKRVSTDLLGQSVETE